MVKGSRPDDADLAAAMDRLFEFEDRKDASGTMNNWSSINFYHVPLAAGITILSKIQSDVRNAEGEVVKRMMDAVEGQELQVQHAHPDREAAEQLRDRGRYLSGGDLPGCL